MDIISPLPETVLAEGETVVLRGTASDAEDGLLEDEALLWYEDGAKLLGTGRRLDVSTLSPGDHSILLLAQDSAGQMDMEMVPITVVGRPNTQPVADAGPDRSTGPDSPVTLFGDRDGNITADLSFVGTYSTTEAMWLELIIVNSIASLT